MDQRWGLRRVVSWGFALISVIALVVFEQAISAFATKRGWDQLFVNGWRLLTDIGWAGAVAFSFFALAGATLALWLENGLRDRRDEKAKLQKSALFCTAKFLFTQSSDGDLGLVLDDPGSENVAYWAWYLNNGGSRHNEAVLLFVEFEKPISSPEVFANASAGSRQQWRQFSSTDRFMFVDLKGWPSGEIILQAVNSRSLGLERMSELMVWRESGPI